MNTKRSAIDLRLILARMAREQEQMNPQVQLSWKEGQERDEKLYAEMLLDWANMTGVEFTRKYGKWF